MTAFERIGLYVCVVVIGALVGAGLCAAINLVAPALHLPGGQGPWTTVLLTGARTGAIGAAAGGLVSMLRWDDNR